MTWLLWRQHRMQAATAGIVLAVLAILLAITGITMANDYHSAVATCSKPGTLCDGLRLFRGDGAIIDTVNLTVAVPVLVGVFWGTTAIGREYDTGTNVLAWTQSITRRRWVRGKVITLVVSSIILGAMLSVMVSWWSRTLNILHGNRFDPLQFDIQALMPATYCLFAAALGLFAGVLWRRLMPAIATTVAGYLAVRLPIEIYARPNYQTPVTTAAANFTHGAGAPPGAWSLHTDLMHYQQVITSAINLPRACAPTRVRTREQMDACLARYGYHVSSTYQPANRYWTFQWIETGIFVGVAALLITAAVVVVLRRDA